MDYKVGIGYDIHRLVEGRPLFLGAIEIPYIKGLLGHSDGDVLVHAICDALLGALALGDIGEHFPDTDAQYKDADSKKLMAHVYTLVKQQGFLVGNIDVVLLAQEPNLKQFKQEMAGKIAEILEMDASAVNVKATTNEGMGFIGRKEGIACYATVSLIG